VGETTEALHSLVRLMERQATGSIGNTCRQPSVVVVIDELADLLMVGGKSVQVPLTRLTQRGREAGIHIIAATQKPTAAVLGPLVKANFPVRLTGRVTSIEDARTATGWSGTGAERLMGRGDFLAVAEGRAIRFQTAYVSPAEIQEMVSRVGNPEWRVGSGEWRIENGRGEALSGNPSPMASSRKMSLPWPARRLSEVFGGGA